MTRETTQSETVPITVSEDTLTEIGHAARNEHAILGSLDLSGKNVRGSCIEITKHIISELQETHGLPENAVIEYRCNVGESMELHYAVGVHTSHVEDMTGDGFVIVDASIDQFCDEQAATGRINTSFGAYDSIPRVAVLPVGDERRQHWYHNPTGEHDTGSEFKPE